MLRRLSIPQSRAGLQWWFIYKLQYYKPQCIVWRTVQLWKVFPERSIMQPSYCQSCLYGGSHHPIMGWYCEACSEKFSKLENNFHEIVTCEQAYGTPKCKESARVRKVHHITTYTPLFPDNAVFTKPDTASVAHTFQYAMSASAADSIVAILKEIKPHLRDDQIKKLQDAIRQV